jgi:hypothetical protein
VLAHSNLSINELAGGAFRIGYESTLAPHSGPLS